MGYQERRFSGWTESLAALEKPGDEQQLPILALHGWLDNAASFLPLMGELEARFVALDFAGHGYSGHRPQGAATHYIDHVRDVLTVLDQLGWQRCILLGHSMGAGVASLFAGTFPERVAKLVLIEGLGPPSTEPAAAAQTLRQAITDMIALPGKQKPVYAERQQAVLARTRGFGGLSVECAALLSERGLETCPDGVTWRSDARLRLTSSLRLSEAQVEGFLRAIVAPTLLVLGDQGMAGVAQVEPRLEWLRQVSVVSLPGRHHLHMETPAAVAAAIRQFLQHH